jgi:hypothetical protein
VAALEAEVEALRRRLDARPAGRELAIRDLLAAGVKCRDEDEPATLAAIADVLECSRLLRTEDDVALAARALPPERLWDLLREEQQAPEREARAGADPEDARRRASLARLRFAREVVPRAGLPERLARQYLLHHFGAEAAPDPAGGR